MNGTRQVRPGLVIVVVLMLMLVPAVAWSQEAAPAVESVDVVITMGADGRDLVEATYRVANTGGLEGGVVDHLLVARPGVSVDGIEAAGDVDGQPVREDAPGIAHVKVPVTGDPATYTLTYTVTREQGAFAVPVLVPAINVASSQRNVTIRALLPEGLRLAGEAFPAVVDTSTEGGRTALSFRTINVPAVVIAEYGDRNRFTLSDVTSVVGLIAAVALVILWNRLVMRGESG
ncbi:MAG TPA: hypothetical protein VF282_04355 [Bacillota bacterium]